MMAFAVSAVVVALHPTAIPLALRTPSLHHMRSWHRMPSWHYNHDAIGPHAADVQHSVCTHTNCDRGWQSVPFHTRHRLDYVADTAHKK